MRSEKELSNSFNTMKEGFMRQLIQRILLGLVVIGLSLTAAQADDLKRVEVSAPAINCLFDPTCRVVVTDSTDTIPIPASKSGVLQSRTFRGRPGTPAAGLYVYEYRIDLRGARGILYPPCLNSMTVDFGPIVRSLDFDGDGSSDEVFVVTRGGLGNVGLVSADKSGNRITFNFNVCTGGGADEGQSTFFFGLVSTNSPIQTTASILESRTGKTYQTQVRVPRLKDPLQREIHQGDRVDEAVDIKNRRKDLKVKDPLQRETRQGKRVDEAVDSQKRRKGATAEDALQREIRQGDRVDEAIDIRKRKGANADKAVVDRISPQPCVERGSQVTVYGSGFGRQPDGRVLELGGHGIGVLLQVISWSDTRITALVPDENRIERGQWYYIGLQNQDRHWISNISRTVNICRALQ